MKRIPLRDRAGRVRAFALVDDEDAERVLAFCWSVHSEGYAGRQPRSGYVLLHRFVMGLEAGDAREVDHKNFDRLDCQKHNLRVLTKKGNRQHCRSRGGTSRFRGVSWYKRGGKWSAQLYIEGVKVHLGYFEDELAAARAVDARRLEVYESALPDPELRAALAEAAAA